MKGLDETSPLHLFTYPRRDKSGYVGHELHIYYIYQASDERLQDHCINGLICVGLVYPSSYPVDSIYKGTPVITSKNIITIMFMIPSNQQVRKRLVR